MFSQVVSWLLAAVVLSPLVAFAGLGVSLLLNFVSSEAAIIKWVRGSVAVSWAAVALLVVASLAGGTAHTVHYLTWFTFEDAQVRIGFALDTPALVFLFLVTLLSGLVTAFSETYLHAEQGFARFHMLLLLASFGMTLVILADDIGLVVVGWEFMGIASTLLIAFYHGRASAIENGFRAFIAYRLSDIGLLLAFASLHHQFGAATWSGLHGHAAGAWPSGEALLISLLLITAAAGKSSIFPFFPWLPKAMEGPTPSSALCYGAFAVVAGPYLLLRAAPALEASPAASNLLIAVGALSCLYTTIVGRSRTDIKTALAYASLAQVSLIFVEIGLHWFVIATLHTAGHVCLRTYQFLRAPSALHDLHVRDALGVESDRSAFWFDKVAPRGFRLWLYRLALEEGGIESLYRNLFLSPFLAIARRLAHVERTLEHAWLSLMSRIAGEREDDRIQNSAEA